MNKYCLPGGIEDDDDDDYDDKDYDEFLNNDFDISSEDDDEINIDNKIIANKLWMDIKSNLKFLENYDIQSLNKTLTETLKNFKYLNEKKLLNSLLADEHSDTLQDIMNVEDPNNDANKKLLNCNQLELNMVEFFLQNLHLTRLFHFFHDFSFRKFLCITDDQLINLGILSYVDRRQILMSIKMLHKTNWDPSTFYTTYPRFNKRMSFAESSTVLANMNIHIELANATLDYIQGKLISEKINLPLSESGSVIDLYLNIFETNSNIKCLHQKLIQLQTQIRKIKNSKEIQSPDYVDQPKNKTNLKYLNYLFLVPFFASFIFLYNRFK